MRSVRARHVLQCSRETAVSILPREIEVRQRARRIEIRIRIEALDEGVRLMAQIALDLELGLRQVVTNVIGKLQPPSELGAN